MRPIRPLLLALGFSLILTACTSDVVKTVIVTEIVEVPITVEVTATPDQTEPTLSQITICADGLYNGRTGSPYTLTDDADLAALVGSRLFYAEGNYSYRSRLLKEIPSVENGMVTFDKNESGNLAIVTYHFRDDILWSDGEPFTVDDITFTFDAFLVNFNGHPTPSLVKIDDYTLTMTLRDSFRMPIWVHMFNLSLASTDIFPEHLLVENPPTSEATQIPLPYPSLGAYQVVDWQEDTLILEANPYWWQSEGRDPAFQTINFRFILDPNELLANTLSGECDFSRSDGFTREMLPFIQEIAADGGIEYRVTPTQAWEQITFNIAPTESAPNDAIPFFADLRVRQAIAYGTDRQAIADAIFFGEGQVQHGYLPDSHYLALDGAENSYPYDPDKARALLFDAGWRDIDGDGLIESYADLTGEYSCRRGEWLVPAGTFFEVDYHYPTNTTFRERIALEFAEDMREIGIVINPIGVEQYNYFNDEGILLSRQFQLGNLASRISSPFRWTSDYNGQNIYQTPEGTLATAESLLEADSFLLTGYGLFEVDFIGGSPEPEFLPDGYTLFRESAIPSVENEFNGFNFGGYCNSEVSQLLLDASLTSDSTEPATLMADFQRIFLDELPALPLFQRISFEVFRPDLCVGERGAMQSGTWNIEDWYLAEDGVCD